MFRPHPNVNLGPGAAAQGGSLSSVSPGAPHPLTQGLTRRVHGMRLTRNKERVHRMAILGGRHVAFASPPPPGLSSNTCLTCVGAPPALLHLPCDLPLLFPVGTPGGPLGHENAVHRACAARGHACTPRNAEGGPLKRVSVPRACSAGAKAIPIPVKNCGILHEKEHLIVNRVEVNTGFNFDKVQRLMLTDPIPCPVRTGYWYVSVLLFTDKPVPLILPYTYEKNKHNKLAEWVFINNNMARSRHAVNFAD